MLPVSFNVETVVVKVGCDGSLVKEHSSLGYAECENIVVIIDPRRPRKSAYREIMEAFDGDDSKMSRVKLAFLMPSTSSSKESLLMAEFALYNLALSEEYPATAQRLFIRMDDYLAHGVGIISAMIAKEKTVYPAEEQANMLAMLKQFPDSVFNYRAWCHFYVGDGGQEMEVCDFLLDPAGAAALLGKEDAGLASIAPVPKDELLSTGAMFAQSAPSLFLAFNENTASTMKGVLGADVTVCTPCDNPGGIPGDEVPTMNEANMPAAFKTSEAPPSQDIAEGADSEAAIKEMVDEAPTPISTFQRKDCIMLIDADKDLADVPVPEGYYCGSSYPAAFMSKFREEVEKPLVSIVMADSYASLVANRHVSSFLQIATAICDIVLFCLKSDTEHVKTLCTGAKFTDESVMDSFIRCNVPFSRLHFFTFANNMGRELPDGSILGTSFTISADSDGANNIAASKYLSNVPNPNQNGKTTPLFTLTNTEGQAATDRVLPGAPGITTTTIINNVTFIQDLCKALMGEDPKDEDGEPQEGQSLKKFFLEAGYSQDYADESAMTFKMALGDLADEYKQYADCVTALPLPDDDDEEGD